MNNITVKISGQNFNGWKSLEMSRSIESMSGAFRLKAIDLEQPWLLGKLKAGAEIDIIIDDVLMMRGYIDVIDNQYDGNRSSISITGRDRVSDLLECAAVVDGAHEFKDQTLDNVIKAVLKPYSIALTISADMGDKIPRLAINPSETAFEFIERICRYRSVMPISDGVGGLHLVKAGTQDSNASLIYGVNILAASASMDYRDLFSEYIFRSQTEADIFTTPKESASPEGRAKDDKVKRYRPHVEIAETQGHSQTLTERAKWQKQFNRARALHVSITVQGLNSNKNGDVWKPNTLVHVKCPKLVLDRKMLITTVTISRDNGTQTVLNLALPDAFDLPVQTPPKDNNDVWGET